MKNGEKKVYPLQNHNGTILQTGLTKREYFAGLAMQGLISTHTERASIGFPFDDTIIDSICQDSVKLADELLKQLENETTK